MYGQLVKPLYKKINVVLAMLSSLKKVLTESYGIVYLVD